MEGANPFQFFGGTESSKLTIKNFFPKRPLISSLILILSGETLQKDVKPHGGK